MTTSGGVTFFDGATSARHAVTVTSRPDVLRIRAADGTLLGEWPYDKLEAVPAPEACSASARPAARCSHGSRFATGVADAIGNRSLPWIAAAARAAHAGQGDRLEPDRDRLPRRVAVWGVPRDRHPLRRSFPTPLSSGWES